MPKNYNNSLKVFTDLIFLHLIVPSLFFDICGVNEGGISNLCERNEWDSLNTIWKSEMDAIMSLYLQEI
jgi:hypothetical protein